MRLSFWGVRGSTPSSKPETWRYGGHTPCVELRADDQLIILDAGTGIQELGHELSANFASPGLTVHLFLTHYHYDHIQGLPFFEPLYFAGNTLRILGPWPQDEKISTIDGILHGLFRPPFFPVQPEQFGSTYSMQELEWDSDFKIGNIRVRSCRTRHPQSSVAYRFDHNGNSLVYATDHEPGDPERDQAVRRLAQDADVLISDAQYRPEELGAQRAGWGHGSWEAAISLARDAGVKNLVLFHHDPFRADADVDELLAQAREKFPSCYAAAEGMVIEITAGKIKVGSRGSRVSPRTPLYLPVQVEATEAGQPVRAEGRLQNISFHGAYFLSPRPYELQELVDLDVTVSQAGSGQPSQQALPKGAASEGGHVRLRGHVVRIDEHLGEPGWVGVAVHFPESAVQEETLKPSKPKKSK